MAGLHITRSESLRVAPGRSESVGRAAPVMQSRRTVAGRPYVSIVRRARAERLRLHPRHYPSQYPSQYPSL